MTCGRPFARQRRRVNKLPTNRSEWLLLPRFTRRGQVANCKAAGTPGGATTPALRVVVSPPNVGIASAGWSGSSASATPALSPADRAQLAHDLDQHSGTDSSALRAAWGQPWKWMPADRLPVAMVDALLSLFDQQIRAAA